jgi:hypothetical protein
MVAPRADLTTDEAIAEFVRLYTQCTAAIGHANAVLQSESKDSEAFLQADRKAAALWQRLREVQALTARPRLA